MKKYLIVCAAVFLSLTIVVQAQEYNFSRNLSVGTSGSDVAALQSWLMARGYDIPSVSSGRASKGYFGSQTRAALMQYQGAIGLPSTGFLGPLTRGRINGGGAIPQPIPSPYTSLRVISPNGYEVFAKGTTQTISWTGSPELLAQYGKISLIPEPKPCPVGMACAAVMQLPYDITRSVYLGNQSYSWNVGSVLAFEGCSGSHCNPAIPDGRYQVQICSINSYTCDASDNYITIVSNNTYNQPPVLNSIDAPVSLAVNQVGTWTVRATDPQGSSLNYSVDWGDTVAYEAINCPAGYICTSPVVGSTQQGSTFTHSYSRPGTYTARFTIRNSAGLTTQTTVTTKVTQAGIAAAPLVVSPNGGETWVADTARIILWSTAGYDANTKIDIYLDQANIQCITTPCGSTYILDRNIPINTVYNWIVATDINNAPIPQADYKVRVCLAGSTMMCDSSNGHFFISRGYVY